MKRFIFFLFIFSNAYGQNFIEDVSKIQHKIAETEVDLFLKKPTSDGLPEIYLNALMPVEGFNPYLMCPIDTDSYKPQDMKYRVLLVSETIPTEPTEIKETTVVLQKLDFEEEEREGFAKTVEEFIDAQKVTPGKFAISETHQKGKQLITYSANGLSVNMNSTVRASNRVGMDVTSEDKVAATMTVDFVNRLGVTQVISPRTQVRGTVETLKSTGTQAIDDIGNAGVEINRVNAEVKLDSKIDENVSTYTSLTYRNDDATEEVKTQGGLNLNLPNSNRIVVLTGVTTTRSPALQSRSREYSIEYVTQRNFRWFGRVRNTDAQGSYYETGIKVDLDKL